MIRLILIAGLLHSCCGLELTAATPDGYDIPGPAASPVPSPTATGTRPAPSKKPRTASPPRLQGTASWFRSPSGVSAAGPGLRRAIGRGWRGTTVKVCSAGTCSSTVLGDWCACGSRIIDLDDGVFSRIVAGPGANAAERAAALSRGLVKVTVSW